MLKRHSRFFKSVNFAIDIGLLFAAWLGAYMVRFYTSLPPAPKEVPPLSLYMRLLPIILIAWAIVFHLFNLYRPRRISSGVAEFVDIIKACGTTTILTIALSFFLQRVEYSRLVCGIFFGLSVGLIFLSRLLFRKGLRMLRSRGYNMRYALIIGAGTLGRDLAEKLHAHHEIGTEVIGFLTRRGNKIGQTLQGIRVLGTYNQLPEILAKHSIDQVFLALPRDADAYTEEILACLRTQMVDVRIVPDLIQFATIRGHAEFFDGLPIVTLQAAPSDIGGMILKRAIDIVFSIIVLLTLSPVFISIALLIRLTSVGPILYRQKRVGYDGRVFTILKFRSMSVDAEDQTGPVFAKAVDGRRTRVGTFLRKTSLDEIPQFWNILRGEMSVVGPRPERPEFVEKFRTMVPLYMLRHKVKAGLTGWSQVNGLRGDTPIADRVRCDLEYIENWSPMLDLKIIWMTLWRGFINKNAY